MLREVNMPCLYSYSIEFIQPQNLGVHLTAHSYPVSTFLKQLTCTECTGKANTDRLKKLTKESIDQFQTGLFNHKNNNCSMIFLSFQTLITSKDTRGGGLGVTM